MIESNPGAVGGLRFKAQGLAFAGRSSFSERRRKKDR